MTLQELVRSVAGFSRLPHAEKIRVFSWWLHAHDARAHFTGAHLKGCYDEAHLPAPANMHAELKRLRDKRPPELLRSKEGYRLSADVRQTMEKRHGEHETILVVTDLLRKLPGRITNQAERVFLSEALTCYKHQAFRAAIVMTWNLAYDHLLEWILADATRLASFNTAIAVRYPKKSSTRIHNRESFENLKESEVVEICATASLFSTNVKRVLADKLTRRNMAAHPSLISIGRAQADDVITDLVENVVLKLV